MNEITIREEILEELEAVILAWMACPWRPEKGIPALEEGWEILLRGRDYQPPAHPTTAYPVPDPNRRVRTIKFSRQSQRDRFISNHMRTRYLASLHSLIRFLKSFGRASICHQAVSDVKGLVHRCLLHNTPDWQTVHESLGAPRSMDLTLLIQDLHALREAILNGDEARIGGAADALLERPTVEILSNAAIALTAGGPVVEDGEDTHIDRVRVPVEQKGQLRACSTSKTKLRKARREHERTQRVLVDYLQGQGYRVWKRRRARTDAFAWLESGPAIFEVKSVRPENESKQCDTGLAQLYKYRFRLGLPEASLWLVLSQRPCIESVSFLRDGQSIRVLWLDGAQLSGPDIGLLA